MKQLILIRHAKSSWKNPDLADFDRPLNKRGLRDAPLMGEKLASQGYVPDFMISSPAARARQTTQLLAEKLGFPPAKIEWQPQIYEANVANLLSVINGIPDACNRAALVGHNPGLTSLCYVLTQHDVQNIPTCGIVVVGLKLQTWREVAPKCGEFVLFDFNKRHL